MRLRKYIFHIKYGPIDLYGESDSSRRLWIACEMLYLLKSYITVSVVYKDVGCYSTCLRVIPKIMRYILDRFYRVVLIHITFLGQ